MYLVFDTETTGLPKNWKAPMKDVENWPRVIQLAWALHDESGQLLKSRCDLITPKGWVMPEGDFWKKHGYSQEKSLAEGIDIAVALAFFMDALQGTRYLIAHNMAFDQNIVGAEMIRLQFNSENKVQRVCTMKSTIDFVQAPGRFGFKFPTLTELHMKLFNSEFEGAHDALNDVMACAKCFFELKNRGIINLTP